ncbi:MAG: hypothetical protein RQ758_02385 [Methanomicrobiaceae archaeon]|nr:hypothetical protein [Methanomicrobiaceae archaeon]
MDIRRWLIGILLAAFLIFSVQATVLTITVRDDDDNSLLSGASIYVEGKYLGKTDTDGKYVYNHTRTSAFTLKVTKTGYDDWSDDVSKDRTSLTVDLVPETAAFTAYVYDADSLSPLRDVTVEVTEKGTTDVTSDETDSSGKATFDLMVEKTYSIEISAGDYKSAIDEVEVEEQGAITRKYWLFHEERFVFRVVDDADDDPLASARIFVDGKEAGVTGSDGLVTTHLDRGKSYDVRVERSGYRTYSEKKTITEGDLFFEIALSLSTYSLTISVKDEAGGAVADASVFLDGKDQGDTDSSGELEFRNIVEGSHELKITRDGYVTWQQTREITGQVSKIVATMEFIPVDVSIRVEDSDHQVLPGAEVRANGELLGITDAAGLVEASLDPGTYNFTAALNGYTDASSVRDIGVGSDEIAVTLVMERKFDPVLIAMLGVGIVAVIAVALLALRFWNARGRSPRRRGGF